MLTCLSADPGTNLGIYLPGLRWKGEQINDDPYAQKTTGQEPEQTSSCLPEVEVMNPEDTEEEPENVSQHEVFQRSVILVAT